MEEEFIQLVEKHQGIIHKVSRLYRDTREDQEDLFQEIVFQLWKSFPGFRAEAKVSTWVYRIALNTAIAIFRKNTLDLVYEARISEKHHPESVQDLSENEEKMYEALRQLNEAERALISLYLDEYTYREIAEIVGISESNVGVKLNRIKTKLKTLLN